MKTIETYTLEELKANHPEGYDKAFERFRSWAGEDVPWINETLDSLKAVIGAFGFKMQNWSVGPYSPSDITIGGYAYELEWSRGRALVYARRVLRDLGYCDGKRPTFPGLCKLTGYCADDDFLESAWKDLLTGSTLRESLEGLAGVASRMMEDDVEQACSEESFEVWAEGQDFLPDGRTV